MTVTLSVPVQPRMWRGYDDPGLPVGAYISQGLEIGDVSGGVLQIEHAFKLAGEPGSARLYNIEQMSVLLTDPTGVSAFVVVVGFEDLPTTNVTVQRWRFQTVNDGGGFATLPFTDLAGLPVFIGQSTAEAAVLAAVNVGLSNPGAGISLQSVIQGYIWEPRAAQAEGGLRRPVEGLYGH